MTSKLTIEQTLAPDADPAWAEEFILRLRLNDVPGEAIANALAEANDHIRTSGTTALEAFGPAEAYADSLIAEGFPREETSILALTVPAILGVLGIQLLVGALHPLRDGMPMTLTIGIIISTAAIVAMLLVLGLASRTILTQMVKRPIPAGVITGVLFMACVLLPSVLRQPVAQASPWVSAILGLLFVAASTVLNLRLRSHGLLGSDPLIPPSQRAGTPSRSPEQFTLLLALMFPVVTVVVGIIVWLLP